MAFIYGNNFGDLAQTRMGYDQLNFQVAKNQQEAFQRQQDQQRESAVFQQRQQEEDQRQKDAQAYQYYQAAQAQQRDQQDKATDAFRFGQAEQDKAAERQQQQYQFGANLDLQKQQAAVKTSQQDSTTKFSEAAALVKNGKYDDSPDDIVKDFPGLAPQQYAVLNSLWDAKNKKALTVFAKASAEADAANASLQKQPGYLDKNRMQLAAHGVSPVITPTSTNFVPTMPHPYVRPVAAPTPNAVAPTVQGNIQPNQPPPVAPTASYTYPPPMGLADRGTVVGPTGVTPPASHIAYLQSHASDPKVIADFNAKYGDGAAQTYLVPVEAGP